MTARAKRAGTTLLVCEEDERTPAISTNEMMVGYSVDSGEVSSEMQIVGS